MDRPEHDSELETAENERRFNIQLPEPVKAHWPLGFLAIGLAAIATGAGLAGTGHPLALIPIGTSNLSMVISMSGASLALCSILLWYGTSKKFILVDHDGNEITDWQGIGHSAIAAAAVAGIGYGGVHIGMAQMTQLLPSDIGTSIGAQFGIGIGVGLGIAAILSLYFASQLKEERDSLIEFFRRNKAFFAPLIPICSVLCATSTIAGPALSLTLGAAATNTVERVAMESVIAVSIASLVVLAIEASFMVLDASNRSNSMSRGGTSSRLDRIIPVDESD